MSSAAAVFRLFLACAALLAPTAALAHVGHGEADGLVHGFMHPVGGLDHVLAMVAVGLFAANLGGRALWAAPLAFVLAMAAGGALGIAAIGVPYVELAIALSVVVLGLAVATQLKLPVLLAMLFVAAFAIFHGYAHGEEMPADASGAAYAAGFMMATALLHLAGIAIGLGIARISANRGARATQVGGAAISLAGVAMMTGVL